jgi:capsular polysaccharide biosynthesis protein
MTPARFVETIQRRYVIVCAVIAVGLGIMFALRNVVPATYAGVSHVVLVAESGARDPSVGIVDLPSIATSTVVLERVRDTLKLPTSLIDLKTDVSATILGRSSIMAIGARDKSAEQAIAISNAVADELSRYYEEISTQSYDANVSRLSDEMRAEAARMRAVNRQMTSVAAANPFVISDKSVDDITTQIATLSDQRAAAVAQLAGDRALAATTLPNAALAKTERHEILASDPTYVATRASYGNDSAQLASDRASYTDSFPGLRGEMAKISGEANALRSEAAHAMRDPDAYSPAAAAGAAEHTREMAVVAGDEARLSQINDRLAVVRSQLQALPGTGGTYAQLSEELSAIQTEYNALSSRRANALANRAEASSLGSVVVLDRALKADTQLAGGRSRAAVAFLVLVLAMAIGAAFLVESLDPRIRRATEVEELYGIPVVASFGAKG